MYRSVFLHFNANGPRRKMALETQQDLVSSYADHFTVVRADTRALLDEVFRLRYQVYCRENSGFENPDEHQDGRERDSDDDRSIHALLMHKRTGAYAGTVRVILPARNTSSSRPLPIHGLLDAQGQNFLSQLPPARHLAEISRFAVSKEFRRRRGDERYADADWPSSGTSASMSDERRALPFITFGLIGAVLEICREQHTPWIAAVMEPALIRIFHRFGVNFERIGEPVEHHGTRWCCVARLADLIGHARAHDTLLSQYTRQQARRSSAKLVRAIVAA
jgi:N-acyl amino acid synthase of PEP-CTERM/exosortase system